MKYILIIILYIANYSLVFAQESVPAYWKAIGDDGFYSSPQEACYRSHQAFAANEGLRPNVFNPGERQWNCRYDPGHHGYWGTEGYAVLRCPSGTTPTGEEPNSCSFKQDDLCAVQTDHPISILSGRKHYQETDFVVGRGRLKLERYYVHNAPTGKNPMGLHWGTNFHPLMRNGHSWWHGTFFLYEPSGEVIRFKRRNSINGGGWFQAGVRGTEYDISENWRRKDQLGYTLTEVTRQRLILKNPDGVEREFDFLPSGDDDETAYDGLLTGIQYPDGYRIDFNYDSDRILESVIDSDQHEIRFSYNATGFLETVTAPDQSIYRYEHDLIDALYADLEGGIHTLVRILSTVHFPDDTPSDSTDNPQRRYHYEDDLLSTALTRLEDERGETIRQWSYDYIQDEGFRAVESVGPNGREHTQVSIEEAGTTYAVTNAKGRRTVYTYGAERRGMRKLTSVEGIATANCAASNSTRSYNDEGVLIEEVREENQKIVRSIDPETGLPTSISVGADTPDAVTTQIQWDTEIRKPTRLSRPGLTTHLSYDSDQNLSLIQRIDTHGGAERTTELSWSEGGLLTGLDGPLPGPSDRYTYSYDGHSNLTQITDPVGLVTRFGDYDAMGRPRQITAPNGLLTELHYTPRGWLQSLTMQAGDQTRHYQFSYDATGNLTRLTLPSGGYFDYFYDASGWLSRASSSLGEAIDYRYDLLGNIEQIDIRGGHSGFNVANWSLVHDDLGRLTQVTGGAGDVRNLAWDRSSRLVQHTDGLGFAWTQSFDALDRVISAQDPEQSVVQTEWGLSGEVDALTDANQLTTRFERNGFGEVTREISPDRGTREYQYDAAGRVSLMRREDGLETAYEYDAAGRLTAQTYPGTKHLDRHFIYDATPNGRGQLSVAQSGEGNTGITRRRAYDGFGALISEQVELAGRTYSTSFDYDAMGDWVSLTYPSGRRLNMLRDSQGRALSLSLDSSRDVQKQSVIEAIRYHPFGPLAGFTYPSGQRVHYKLDTSYRLQEIELKDGAHTLYAKRFDYDAAGQILQQQDVLVPDQSASYTYSPAGRLTRAASQWTDTRWTYDGVGNRLSEDEAVKDRTDTYHYAPGSNRLVEITRTGEGQVRELGYNSAGDVITDRRLSEPHLDLIYDGRGRLSELHRQEGPGIGWPTSYLYDDRELRVWRRSVTGAVSHFIFLDEGRLLGEYDGATGAVIMEYIWLDDRLVGQVDGAGKLSSVLTGHLGQPARLMSVSGVRLWQAEMDPFGRFHTVQGGTPSPDLHLPGQWAEPGSGLYQNWHRSYDPSLGRYLQADPMGLAGGQSVYGYAYQNPMSYVDPEGRFAILRAFRLAYQGGQQVGRGINAYRAARNAARVAAAEAVLQDFMDVYDDRDVGICKPLITLPIPILSWPMNRDMSLEDDRPDDDFCKRRWEAENLRCDTVSGRNATSWRIACRNRAADRLRLCIRNGGSPDPGEPNEWPG